MGPLRTLFFVMLVVHAGAGAAEPTEVMEASELIGMPAQDRPSGATGRIVDLVVDLANNRVHYAVLDMENRRIAQPLSRMEIREGRAVMQAPADPGPVAPRAGMALVRASTLLGWDFENLAGERLGKIVELMVAPQTGRIPYARVQLASAPGGELRRMALDRFAMHPMRENLVLEEVHGRGAAGATTTTVENGQIFRRLDRDKDGYLSERELDRPIAERRNWLAIDLDRDGRISREEFSAMQR